MKKLIVFLFSIMFLTSCLFEYHDTKPTSIKGILIEKNYKPEHQEYCYHYGWNYMKMKNNWHWGMHTKPEYYSVKFVFLNDTNSFESKVLYNNITDTFKVVYKDRYLVTKKDSSFHNHVVIGVIIKNDTIKL